MKIEPKKILKQVEDEGFEKVWIESGRMLPKRRRSLKFSYVKGKPHPIFDIMMRMRQTFLDMGFNETIMPIIVEDEEVYRQYGPEAPVILDRCYYLATLPRPDIGLSKEKYDKIQDLGVPLNKERVEALQRILREYKRGEIEADDLVEKISDVLETTDIRATQILTNVFSEFKALKPVASSLTLRSHMTSTWFGTLRAIQHKATLPIRLFSVDVRFRREQSEDATHLRAHHGASCVFMDEYITADDGKDIAKTLLSFFGLKQIRFVKKRISSKYYAPDTEFEGFVWLPKKRKWIEVVDLGLYSPIALAQYGIEYPVLNVGAGVERISMILQEESDIRRLAYPQFYTEWFLSDEELAGMIWVSEKPDTAIGYNIMESIINTAIDKAEEASPCEFTAFEGEISDRKIKVTVYEKDIESKLLGPAALNRIYVYQGNILGIPESGMEDVSIVLESREKGISTNIRFLNSVAALAATKIEKALKKRNPSKIDVRVRMAKLLSDVNLKISDVAQHYVTSKKKRIIVKGPVFIGIKAEIMKRT